MLINGWDIKEANAKQARFVNGHHKLANDSSWNPGSNRPIFQRNQMGFKPFKLDLWVKGNGYEEIVKNRGIILSHLVDVAVIKPDNTSHYFKAVMNKSSISEKSKQHWHVLSLEFNGYEYADEEEFSIEISTSFGIVNTGTTETPVIVELVPKGGAIDIPYDQMVASILCDEDGSYLADGEDGVTIASLDFRELVIEGLCRDPRTGEDLPITIRNITPGKKIVINGKTGLITEEGIVKIDDVDIWALPTIQPGENRITTNNNWLDITVRYEPRFM